MNKQMVIIHHQDDRDVQAQFLRCVLIEGYFLFLFQVIAETVTEKHLAEGRMYPPLSTIRDVSFKIATKVWKYFYQVIKN